MKPAVLAPLAVPFNCPYPWVPDQGDGTYRNPVLFADYSDPDIIRVGDDYWMTASSFNCTPGLPILHSKDLVNWTIVNHALINVPGERYSQVQHGCGVWAPAIRFHQGKYWIFFATPDEGIYLTTSEDPRGRWSEPHLVCKGKGLIDPCPLWDDDGKAYLVHAYAHSRSGIKHKLRVCPMDSGGERLLGEGQIVFHEPDRHHTIEGPKFQKRGAWYYILAPAGGVATGWQTVLRSKHVYGPYEARIVLEQSSTSVNGPHQGALVDSADGQWWFAHFQDSGLYGRIMHLQPVVWRDGWPEMGEDQDGNGIGEPVLEFRKPEGSGSRTVSIPQTSDEFENVRLGLQWQWHANHEDSWYSLSARPGWLRLFARPLAGKNLSDAPHLLLQKLPASEFAVETLVDLGATPEVTAGLAVVGRSHAAIFLRSRGGGFEIGYVEDGRENWCQPVTGCTARLRVKMSEGGKCDFAFAAGDDKWIPANRVFQAQAGVWISAKVGLIAWAASGTSADYADFDYFRFAKVD